MKNTKDINTTTTNEVGSKKKVIIIIASIFAVVGIMAYLFSGSSKDTSNVRTANVEGNTGIPIQSEDDEYTKQVLINNENLTNKALEEGGSHLDIQTNELSGEIDDDDFLPRSKDESNKNNQEEKTQHIIFNNTIIKEVAVPEVVEYDYLNDYSLVSMFSEEWAGKDFAKSNISNLAKREELKKQKEAEELKNKSQISENLLGGKQAINEVALYKVGDLVPAILETRIISTENSPVRVRVASGHLRGAILTGGFEQGRNGVIIKLTTLNHEKLNRSIPINAVAMDYKKASTSLASSVNHHIPEKILMTFAGSFAKGYADSMSDNNVKSMISTDANHNVVTEYTKDKKTVKQINKEAGANAISMTADMINSNIPTIPTVKVNQNTEIGVYFMGDLIIDKSLLED